MRRRIVGVYDAAVAVRRQIYKNATAEIELDLWPGSAEPALATLSPSVARALSRRLKAFADIVDPPKKKARR